MKKKTRKKEREKKDKKKKKKKQQEGEAEAGEVISRSKSLARGRGYVLRFTKLENSPSPFYHSRRTSPTISPKRESERGRRERIRLDGRTGPRSTWSDRDLCAMSLGRSCCPPGFSGHYSGALSSSPVVPSNIVQVLPRPIASSAAKLSTFEGFRLN